MAHDYSEEQQFDGFSDQEEPQFSISDDASDDQGRFYDDEASEAASDSEDEPKNYNGFVDDEASEAESDVRSNITFNSNDTGTMHDFKKLPLELREMIWKMFCPDLSVKPRVYELRFDGQYFHLGAHVEDQTAPLRTVLAIHRESRALGHKFAPDLIQLRHGLGVAPCHMERDILFVDWIVDYHHYPTPDNLAILGEAAPGLQNLAFSAGMAIHDGGADFDRFSSLKNVFIDHLAEAIPSRGLTWCLSDNNQTYHVVYQEDVGCGIMEDVDILYSWPDPDKYGESEERAFSSRRFASLHFDQDGMAVDGEGERIENADYQLVSQWGWEISYLRERLDPLHEMEQPSADQSRSGSSEPEDDEQENEDAQAKGREAGHEEEEEEPVNEKTGDRGEQGSPPRPQRISVWPFTRFTSSGMARLEAMRAWQKPWDEWESDFEMRESVERWSDISSDSLNGFIASNNSLDEETDVEEDSSQAGDEEDSPRRAAQHRHAMLDSGDDEETTTGTVEPSRARPRNRAVIDLADSSEEGEAEDAMPQRVGGSSRRARARARPIPVDSEDDDDHDLPQPSRAGARRALVLLSESENDNEGVVGRHRGSAKVEDEDDSSSASSEEEEDESDEELAPTPRMSLAKRLRLEAAQAREALAADDSDDGEQEGDGYGGASDDEEDASDGNDASEGEEMIMGMAEEDEEDDEETW